MILSPLELKHSFGGGGGGGSDGQLLLEPSTVSSSSHTVAGKSAFSPSSPASPSSASSPLAGVESPVHMTATTAAAPPLQPADQFAYSILTKLAASSTTSPLLLGQQQQQQPHTPCVVKPLQLKDWVLVLSQVSQRRSTEAQRRTMLSSASSSSSQQQSAATTSLHRYLRRIAPAPQCAWHNRCRNNFIDLSF